MEYKKILTICKVCGYDHGYPIWGEDNKSPTHDICECCGTEFGYEDCNIKAIRTNRARWIQNGAQWHVKVAKPKGWELQKSLQNIPKKFR